MVNIPWMISAESTTAHSPSARSVFTYNIFPSSLLMDDEPSILYCLPQEVSAGSKHKKGKSLFIRKQVFILLAQKYNLNVIQRNILSIFKTSQPAFRHYYAESLRTPPVIFN
jgi:hypothetical protein